MNQSYRVGCTTAWGLLSLTWERFQWLLWHHKGLFSRTAMFCAHWKLESDANKWLKGKDFSHCLWFTDSLNSRGTYLEKNNEVDFSWCGTYNNCVFSDLYFLFLWLCLYCVPSSALVPHSSLPSLRSLLKCCSSLSAIDWITVFLSPFLPFLHSLSMWGCCPPLSKTHQSTWTSHGRQKKKKKNEAHSHRTFYRKWKNSTVGLRQNKSIYTTHLLILTTQRQRLTGVPLNSQHRLQCRPRAWLAVYAITPPTCSPPL